MPVSTQTTTSPQPLPLPPTRSHSNSPRDSLVLKATSSLSTSSSSTASLSSNAAAQPSASPSPEPSQPSHSAASDIASSALTTSSPISNTTSPAPRTTVEDAVESPAQANTPGEADGGNASVEESLDTSLGGAARRDTDAPAEHSNATRVFVHPQYLPPTPAQRAGSALAGAEIDQELASNAPSETPSVTQEHVSNHLHQPVPTPTYVSIPAGRGRARSPSFTPRPLQTNGHSGTVSVDLSQSDVFADSPASSPTYTTTTFSSSSSSIASDSGHTSGMNAGTAWFSVPQVVLHAPKEDASGPSMLHEEIVSLNDIPENVGVTAHPASPPSPSRNRHRTSQSSSRVPPQPLRLSFSNGSSHSSHSQSTTTSLHQRALHSEDLRTPITPAYNVYSTYTVGAGGVAAVPVGRSISEGSILGGASSHGFTDEGVLERATSTGTDTSDFLHPAYSGYGYNSSTTARNVGMYEYDNFLDSEPAYDEDGHLLLSPSKSKFGASGMKRSSSGGSSGGLLRRALKGVGGVTVGIGMGAGRVGRLFVPRFLRRQLRPVFAFLGGHSRPLTAPSLSPSTSLRISLSTGATTKAIAGSSSTFLQRWGESPILWLLLYFGLNLSLTLYNKKVLISFPFPYSLTALHAACGSVGTLVMLRMEHQKALKAAAKSVARPLGAVSMVQKKSHLNGKELVTLFLFSILYTLNIVVSNASLRLVTVPFHQVVRASTPFFTIIFAASILGKRCTRRKLFALIPVVVGVGFATYGDYYFTAFGFMLTLLGTVLAALKTILTNCILVKPGAKPTSSVSPASSPNAKHTLPVAAEIGHPLHEHVRRTVSRPTSPVSGKHEYFEVQDVPRDQGPPFPPSFFGSLFVLVKEKLLSSSSSPNTSYENEKLFPPPVSPMSPYSPVSPKSPHAQYAQYSPYSSASNSTGPLGLPTLTLSPLHLLYLMSPLALVQTLLLAYFTGELARVQAHLFPTTLAELASASAPVISGAAGLASPGAAIGIGARAAVAGRAAMAMGMRAGHRVGAMGANGRFWLLLNGILAFFLNVVSFNANRRVGPLGMSVAANVKQVLTVLCAVTMFNLTITPANGVGIALTLLGGAMYAAVELQEKRDREGKRRVG